MNTETDFLLRRIQQGEYIINNEKKAIVGTKNGFSVYLTDHGRFAYVNDDFSENYRTSIRTIYELAETLLSSRDISSQIPRRNHVATPKRITKQNTGMAGATGGEVCALVPIVVAGRCHRGCVYPENPDGKPANTLISPIEAGREQSVTQKEIARKPGKITPLMHNERSRFNPDVSAACSVDVSNFPGAREEATQLDDDSLKFLKELNECWGDKDKNKGVIRSSGYYLSRGADGIVLKLRLKNGQYVVGKLPSSSSAGNLLDRDISKGKTYRTTSNAAKSQIVRGKLDRNVTITNLPEVAFVISFSKYIPGVTLHEKLKTKESPIFKPENIKVFARHLLNEYKELWNTGYMHVDAHASNIMIKPDNMPCLLDFGRARGMSEYWVKRELMTIGHHLLTLALKNPEITATKFGEKNPWPMSVILPSGGQFSGGYTLDENPHLKTFIFSKASDEFSDLRSLLQWLYDEKTKFTLGSFKELELHPYFRD
ncbi:AarF/UbiB family protein [Endozoicomonas atrinae]|uniref:AarF/UbiB family protein n=1 Tax=Endozoicomonas atrinae TaxID=1333660 RepID=UPI0008263B19|nr:AarF/UbiB family protein [Endozoicomonas atrinae]